MRIIKKLFLSFLCTFMCFSFICGINLMKKNFSVDVVSAEISTPAPYDTNPNYFSATLANEDINHVFLYDVNDELIISFGGLEINNYLLNETDLPYSFITFSSNASLKINDEFVENFSLEAYISSGSPIETYPFSPQRLEFSINPTTTSQYTDGVYELFIPYLYHYSTTEFASDIQDVEKSFTYKFLVLNKSKYYSDTNSAIFTDKSSLEFSNINDNISTLYDKYYFYNYQNNTLPTFTFDATRYIINITRINNEDNLSKTTTLSLNYDQSLNKYYLDTTNEIFFEYSLNDDLVVTLIFNDIGEYTFDFEYVYVDTITNTKYELSDYSSQMQKLYIFGSQIFYTNYSQVDITTGSHTYSEFKTVTDNTFKDSADITYLADSINSTDTTTFSALSDISIVSSNQAPYKFSSFAGSSVTINYFHTSIMPENITDSTIWNSSVSLSGNLLRGESGTYLVFVTYYFENYYKDGILQPSKMFSQIFSFVCDTSLPNLSVTTKSEDGDFDVLYSGKYTNKEIYVSNLSTMYDSNTYITLTMQDFNNNILYNNLRIEEATSIRQEDNYYIISNDGKYTLNLYSDNAVTTTNKNGLVRTIYFVRDTTTITGFTSRNVSLIGNSYIITKTFDTFTNEAFVLSWNNKESGASSSASYIRYSFSTLDYYYGNESTLIRNLIQNNNGLAVNSKIAYSDISFWTPYAGNTINLQINNSVDSKYVKNTTEGGLYIFKIEDEAGNVSYFAVILDLTTPVFALYDDNSGYFIPSSIHTIDNQNIKNAQIIWGQNKLIYVDDELINILTNQYNLTSITEKLTQINYLSSNVSAPSVVGLSTYNGTYLSVGIKEQIAIQDATSSSFVLTTNQNGLYSITAQGNYLMEGTYTILIRDIANTKGNDSMGTVQYFTQYYSAMQTLVVNFDTSKIKFYYIDSSDNEVELIGNNVSVVTESSKTEYSNPVNITQTFKISIMPKILISNDTYLKVQTLILVYTPFSIKTETANGEIFAYYTYDKSNAIEYTLYDLDKGINIGVEQDAGVYVFDLPNQSGSLFAPAGKYEIIRTYSETDAPVPDADYATRTKVYYIDNFGVISEQETFTLYDENESSSTYFKSLVGSNIYFAMYDGAKMVDIIKYPTPSLSTSNVWSLYTQVGSTGSLNGLTSLLTTNKMPVGLYIPTMKYATNSYYDGNTHSVTLDNNMNYYSDNTEGLSTGDNSVLTYKLTAKVYRNGVIIAYGLQVEDSNFLKFFSQNSTSSTEITKFTDLGTYIVVITAGTETTSASSFSFEFTIASLTPNFSLYKGLTNSLLENSNDIYYTNQDTLIISYEKPSSDFIAEVDTQNIYLSVTFADGTHQEYLTFSSDNFSVDSVNNTITLDLSLIYINGKSLYSNNTIITIGLKYKSISDVYSYDYSKLTFMVDLECPDYNVEQLASQSIDSVNFSEAFTKENIRSYANFDDVIKYSNIQLGSSYLFNFSNVDQTNTFRNYLYTVNSSFIDSLKSISSHIIYYKDVTATYKTQDETLYTQLITSTSSFSILKATTTLTYGNVYEIMERDLAGNFSIYRIFLVPSDSESQYVVEISKQNGTIDTEKSISLSEFESGVNNIYSLPDQLNITNIDYYNDPWLYLQFTINGENFYLMKSPTKDNYFMKIDEENSEISISEICTMLNSLSSSLNKVKITIADRLSGTQKELYVSVLDTRLFSNLAPSGSTSEYIDFEQPKNPMQNSYAVAFVTDIKIEIFENDTTTTLYNQSSKQGIFTSSSNNTVSVIVSDTFTRFMLNNPMQNTVYKYTYTNNFNETEIKYHIYQEFSSFEELSAKSGNIYAYREIEGEIDDFEDQIIYLATSTVTYSYNTAKYETPIIVNMSNPDENIVIKSKDENGIASATIGNSLSGNYNILYKIELKSKFDTSSTEYLFVRILNLLPSADNTSSNTIYFTSSLSSDAITSKLLTTNSAFFSSVNFYYNEGFITDNNLLVPVNGLIYEISQDDGNTYTKLSYGTNISYDGDDTQNYILRVRYDCEMTNLSEYSTFNQILENVYVSWSFTLSSTKQTFFVIQYVDENGTIQSPTKVSAYEINSETIDRHYIVNAKYASTLTIVVNEELGVSSTRLHSSTSANSLATTEVYLITNLGTENVAQINTKVAITYISESSDFVNDVNNSNDYDSSSDSYYTTWSNVNLKNQSSLSIVAENQSQIMIRWTKFFAVSYNSIDIVISINGLNFTPTLYSDGNYNYIILNKSGQYKFSLVDKAGNIQAFRPGATGQTNVFTLNYLKDVAFYITYENDGETIMTTPINKAIYNTSVTLNIYNRSDYYMTSYPQITVIKDGKKYIDSQYISSTLTLSESGYYEYYFTAISKLNGTETIVQTEKYSLYIINILEGFSNFSISKYSNYYIESVLYKTSLDGSSTDVTNTLLSSGEFSTMTIQNKTYLSSLLLSDVTMPFGYYTITVFTNDSNYVFENEANNKFVFTVYLKSGSVPISISTSEGNLAEGDETSNVINISFIGSNIFYEVGRCYLRVISNNNILTEEIIDESSDDSVVTLSINNAGTYYVEVQTDSGNLLYSFKVIKKDPLNTFAIIAIIVGCVVLIVAVVIVIKLRKKISIK